MSDPITITASELTALSAGEALSIEIQRELIYTPEPGLDHGTIAGTAAAEAAVRAALVDLRSPAP